MDSVVIFALPTETCSFFLSQYPAVPFWVHAEPHVFSVSYLDFSKNLR